MSFSQNQTQSKKCQYSKCNFQGLLLTCYFASGSVVDPTSVVDILRGNKIRKIDYLKRESLKVQRSRCGHFFLLVSFKTDTFKSTYILNGKRCVELMSKTSMFRPFSQKEICAFSREKTFNLERSKAKVP